ncbi:DUF211 domain-containing protein [Acidomonas methanolica]|uniref:DUF211 domain-containing protein n=1 Tax=Acidomonas methanolica NBRC 104435 TaxID=1231351 RepID=A0A023D171_ACIMT|nr:DUF211 domain-containing protein [Acidomonas methanolica]TCS25114.1 hypothetical protein EDC31_12032 [Acidomonas methanolica]GAJ27872.1 hypothetical protein Amme_009_009 [Acidomonas methanolica NBRC 104435]GBQ46101.1 hypothetical protein AA0498_0210 [Acidomonas methanolica]GEK99797.1 hypothetical protein AME01nite_22960 [Acidomonas methanolica NBRC 104435]
MAEHLNVRRILLDVDLSIHGPTLVAVATAIQSSAGVAACSITVTDIDTETIGTDVTIEGENMDYEGVVEAIEKTGAVVHSLDHLAAGDRIIESVPRRR